MTIKEKIFETVAHLPVSNLTVVYFVVAALTYDESKPGFFAWGGSLGAYMIMVPLVIALFGMALLFFWVLYLGFENWLNKIIDIWFK